MDDATVNYAGDRFHFIKSDFSKVLIELGFKTESISFTPLSGWAGENLIIKSPLMSWWDGPTLMQALDNTPPPIQLSSFPLRFLIQDVYKIAENGIVVAGKVETGMIKPHMIVTLAPMLSQLKCFRLTSCKKACLEQAREPTRSFLLPLGFSQSNFVVGTLSAILPLAPQLEWIGSSLILRSKTY